MMRIKLAGSALRVWRNGPRLSPLKRDALVRIWLRVEELALRGEFDELKIGERTTAALEFPQITAHLRRTQISEVALYRVTEPETP